MLVGPFYEIWCEGARCPTNASGLAHGGPTKRDAARQARKRGFRSQRGKLLCSACQASATSSPAADKACGNEHSTDEKNRSPR